MSFICIIVFLWTCSHQNIWIELRSYFLCSVVFGIVLCDVLHFIEPRANDMVLSGFFHSWTFLFLSFIFFSVYSFFNFILWLPLGPYREDSQWMFSRLGKQWWRVIVYFSNRNIIVFEALKFLWSICLLHLGGLENSVALPLFSR